MFTVWVGVRVVIKVRIGETIMANATQNCQMCQLKMAAARNVGRLNI